MTKIAKSELVLNPDGSVYHLGLHPGQVAHTIITVGDPKRVPMVSNHFDKLEVAARKREFITHTGEIQGKRLTVLSTGIGPDNIDIALSELDALVNIDLASREVRDKKVSLNIIRIGTSGSLHPDVAIESWVVSRYGIGLDNLLNFYHWQPTAEEKALEEAIHEFFESLSFNPPNLYGTAADAGLSETLGAGLRHGITLTAPGFYGPQGREIRLPSIFPEGFFTRAYQGSFQGADLTNFEMETAAIYGLSSLLGHRAISFNAVLANRYQGTFSERPIYVVEQLIEGVLERIVNMPD